MNMRLDDIMKSLWTHLQISFMGVFLAMLLGIALATLCRRNKTLKKIVFFMIDVIQTIPTLAMFSFVMVLFGLNNKTVIFSIFLYALFPIIRNTYTGISGIDKGVIRAATGIGMTPIQVITRVELPLALPTIVTGIKLALVSALSIATTGVLIGSGGLGMIIWRGIQTRNNQMIYTGALLVSVLALSFDFILTYVEKRLDKDR